MLDGPFSANHTEKQLSLLASRLILPYLKCQPTSPSDRLLFQERFDGAAPVNRLVSIGKIFRCVAPNQNFGDRAVWTWGQWTSSAALMLMTSVARWGAKIREAERCRSCAGNVHLRRQTAPFGVSRARRPPPRYKWAEICIFSVNPSSVGRRRLSGNNAFVRESRPRSFLRLICSSTHFLSAFSWDNPCLLLICWWYFSQRHLSAVHGDAFFLFQPSA